MKPRNRQSRSLNVSNSRWMAYAVAGMATASGGAMSAEGAIHYSGGVQLHLKGRAPEIWHLPLTAGASLTFYRFALSAPTAGTYFSDIVQVSRNAAVHAIRTWISFYAANLPAGSNVSGGDFSSFFGGLIGPVGQFVSAGVGFVGFKFDVGNGVQYGWVRLRTAKTGTRFDPHVTVLDYAFADPGERILTGQKSTSDPAAPDQGSLGLLALGAAGLTAWRKSRFGVN